MNATSQTGLPDRGVNAGMAHGHAEKLGPRMVTGIMWSRVFPLFIGALLLAASSQAQEKSSTKTGTPAPASVNTQIEEAIQAIQAGRLDEGRITLEIVTREYPTNMRAHQVLAYVYETLASNLKKETSNEATKQEADALMQRAIDLYMRAATLAKEEGNWTVAESMYSRVRTHDAPPPEATLGLAEVYYKTNRYHQAIVFYTDFLKRPSGKQVEAYLALGKACLKGKYWRQAVKALKEASSLDPTNAEVDINLARAYFQLGENDEARQAVDRAVSRAPNNPEHQNSLAILLFDQNEFKEADKAVGKAIELSKVLLASKPDDIELLMMMNTYYETQLRILQALATREEEDNTNKILLQWAQVIQEQAAVHQQLSYHSALDVLDQVPDDDKATLDILLLRASLQMSAYKFDDAAKTCQQVLKRDPGNAEARKMLETLKAGSAQPTSAPSDAGKE